MQPDPIRPINATAVEPAPSPIEGATSVTPAHEPPPRRFAIRREIWTLIGILGLAALARYAGLTQGFPRDFHWDERIYFHEAFYALANGLRREQTVSANLPYLLLPGLLIQWAIGAVSGQIHSFGEFVRSYITDPAPFLVLGRATWAASGVISVAATWRIGRRLGGPAIGLLGAFFLAVAFLPVEEGHFIKNDMPAGLFLLLAIDACFNIQERGTRRDYLWAGFWIGVATATKYYCAGVAPAVLLAHLLRAPADPQLPASQRGGAGRGGRPLLLAALTALAGFVLTTPGVLTDPANVWYNIDQEIGARFGSIPTDGIPQPLFYISQHLGNGLGLPLLGLALVGFALLATRRTPKGMLLLAVPALFFIAINLRPNNFPRYIIPAIPFLCVMAAVALRTGVGIVLSPTLARLRAVALDHDSPALRALTSTRRLRLLGPALLIAGAVLAAAPSWLDVIRYDRYALAPDTRNAAQSWFEGHVPPGARVLIEGGESFERTSNLGPQLWPTAAQLQARGPNEPRERFFWEQLLQVVQGAPAYTLQLVGAFERTTREENGQRVAAPVESVAEYNRPDYIVLISWRSDDLRPGATAPLWQSLTAEYTLVQTFACRPCFPEDYYAWQIDYPTLESIAVTGDSPLAGGPEVRVFQRKDTAFPPTAPKR